ncbi:ATP-binding protein [Cellulomonas sp. ICMP 17802]|uniref:ATP-binding protein n=1 Tax=Cellulomonas sp. ICMP 17802 TaxID=3239199 RepID=UPI00351BA704
MTTPGEILLCRAIATHLVAVMHDAAPGHCVRLDDVDPGLAAELCQAMTDAPDHVRVHVLRAEPQESFEVAPERAIELRNRKQKALLLFVPAGEGHAASSLDNSFNRLPMSSVYPGVERLLLDQLQPSSLKDTLTRVRRMLSRNGLESWTQLIAELCADPSELTLGRNLWRIGLVPDLAPGLEGRLERNRVAANELSRPSRPSSTIDDRLTRAGVEEGIWRGRLRRHLEHQGPLLANPRAWTRGLAETEGLSFDRWPLADSAGQELTAVEVVPFSKPDGSVDPASKLAMGGDGQLVLRVPEGGAGSVVVQWRTVPLKTDSVARWRIEVGYPADLRSVEDEPLAQARVRGALRRATVKVTADEDDLAGGSRFVVTVTPIGEHGEELVLSTGGSLSVDSQEFQVVLAEAAARSPRRTAAASVAEAVVRVALDGQDDLSEDLVSWDLGGQVFGLRLGNRRAIQVRVSELIVRLQRHATAEPNAARHYDARTLFGSVLESFGEGRELELPPALRRGRAAFLGALGSDPQRDTVESARWTPELRAAAISYMATYRRALEGAAPDALADLLQLDTVSLQVKRNGEWIRAVILLPIHPLRLWWVSEHDSVLRGWAEELTAVGSKASRAARIDASLLPRIIPANLPFSTIDGAGHVALYAEELTLGSGLYLVPGEMDRDTAAESVASILGLDRATPSMRAASGMVADRFAAYEVAHDPGETLRVLAVNPGSGELLAGALAQGELRSSTEGESEDDPRRLDVLAYSDSASYVDPLPHLSALQRSLRVREYARLATHVAPPMSLTVRPTRQLLEDNEQAHVALLQDAYASSVACGAAIERKASFGDLLVPMVTRRPTLTAELAWESGPALGVGGGDQSVIAAHRSHQRAIGRLLGGADGEVPVVRAVVDEARQAQLRAAHDRTDWVVGLDRFIGVDLFEGGFLGSFILDYAPDFVEGIGDRLTVTTTQRLEVERLLEGAMRDLGLAEVDQSVGELLRTLTVVSGRLALRLLENNTLAREAVSLAALVRCLQNRGDLTDLIVVPVDAHPEIFGPAGREGADARRCDLLLVRVGQRSFKIECVEVKSRKEAKLPPALADMIVNQLDDTRRLLESRFFSDPPRIDAALQRARLASLLHYYADRSAANGLIDAARIPEVHRYIDRIEESGETAEISMQGYVISLDGDAGFKKRYGDVPLTVLTADDLAGVGLTTRSAELEQQMSRSSTSTVFASPTASPSPVSGGGRAGEAVAVVGIPPAPHDEPSAVEEALAGQVLGHEVVDARVGVDISNSPDDGVIAVSLGSDAHGVEARWGVSTKGSPHAFILGIPGQGKSVTTRRIIRQFASQGLPALVFDFHGDMAADPPADAVVLDAARGLPFSPFEPDIELGRPINTSAWEIAEIVGYVAKLGEIQRNHVYRALQDIYGAKGWVGTTPGSGTPTMAEFVQALETVETSAAGRNAAARLQPFTDFGLFDEASTDRFAVLTPERNGWVVDLSKLGLEEVQRFGASFLLRRVYREMFGWQQNGQMKLAVVLDEAHRMARDVTLPKIMKEGRKYGASVIVASQNVDDFHKEVLSNAGTKIAFRTNFPASKTVSGFLRGRSGVDLSEQLEKLNVGVAYVSTPESVQARKIYMSND